MKLLSIVFLFINSIYAQFPPPGNWATYNEFGTTLTGIHSGNPGLVGVSSIDASIDFHLTSQNGMSGSFEAWAFIDLNVGFNPFVSPVPLMYTNGISMIDADIATSILLTPAPMNIYDGITPSFAIGVPPQAGGTAYSIIWNSINSLRLCRIGKIDLGIPMVPPLQIFYDVHIIGNMNNSVEGSGWFYLYESTSTFI